MLQGVRQRPKKFCIPGINLQFLAPSISFIFSLKKNCSEVGGWVGRSVGRGLTGTNMTPPPRGFTELWYGVDTMAPRARAVTCDFRCCPACLREETNGAGRVIGRKRERQKWDGHIWCMRAAPDRRDADPMRFPRHHLCPQHIYLQIHSWK